MRNHHVRDAFAEGRCAVNAWMSTESSYLAEALSHCGFDSVTIDAQHGMLGRDSLVRLLQAVSAGPATPMVRPSTCDPAEIGWLLDAGAYGIIAPNINTVDDAARLVSACRYPPHGERSFGPSRGLLYGGADYVVAAADTITVWAMIESAEALADLDAIAAVPGLFGLYIGPNDMAMSLGEKPGGRAGEAVRAQCLRIRDAAHRENLAVGIFCADGEEAASWRSEGFDLVTPGNDLSLIRAEASARINAVRGIPPTAVSSSGY